MSFGIVFSLWKLKWLKCNLIWTFSKPKLNNSEWISGHTWLNFWQTLFISISLSHHPKETMKLRKIQTTFMMWFVGSEVESFVKPKNKKFNFFFVLLNTHDNHLHTLYKFIVLTNFVRYWSLTIRAERKLPCCWSIGIKTSFQVTVHRWQT